MFMFAQYFWFISVILGIQNDSAFGYSLYNFTFPMANMFLRLKTHTVRSYAICYLTT